MLRAYKFRLYSNNKQLELINKTFRSSRYVYNYYLDKMKNNGYVSAYTNIKDYTSTLKYDAVFLQEVDSIVIRQSLFNLDDAYKKLFSKTGGYPKFKSKYNRNSYNTTAVYNKYIDKYAKRIKRKQRELARKEKGSKNYSKCKKELAILHSKLANARKNYIHKITKDITDEYDIIAYEKLKTKEMIIKSKESYQINTYYPSSQICSRCNAQDRRYKDLTRREYKCPKCGEEIDRNLNASINIIFEGLKLYMKNYAKI